MRAEVRAAPGVRGVDTEGGGCPGPHRVVRTDMRQPETPGLRADHN